MVSAVCGARAVASVMSAAIAFVVAYQRLRRRFQQCPRSPSSVSVALDVHVSVPRPRYARIPTHPPVWTTRLDYCHGDPKITFHYRIAKDLLPI